jgi:site-specific recombinase XerC
VDINTIRGWMGHVSIATTNIYAQISLEMKAKALAACELQDGKAKKQKPWRHNKGLMAFLKTL